MFDSVNTNYNELGPYSFGFHSEYSETNALLTDIILYANDSAENYDIKFSYCEIYSYADTATPVISTSEKIAFLN